MEQVTHLSPNDLTHPEFGEALRAAAAAGVHIRALTCTVIPGEVWISGEIPVVM